MDRYIIREPRISDYPQNVQSTNQMVGSAGGSNERHEMYLERPLHQNQNFPNNRSVYPYTPATKQDFGMIQMNSPNYMPICIPQGQGETVSGIDPRYLAAYADPNSNYIATGQQMQRQSNTIPAPNSSFGVHYQNRMPSEQIMAKTFPTTERMHESVMVLETPKPNARDVQTNWQPMNNAPIKKMEATDVHKSEIQNQIMSRADKLKALHKGGTKVFSGPVEMVLKWHKAMQDIGVYVLYEIVAKCVNIRPGEHSAKNLVVRDDSGPAMQIVYYEVDFLLPELKPPCTVRIIGRMMSGTSRFQAFNVRAATGDDVATLPRRAAVASHHVSKICKEYSV